MDKFIGKRLDGRYELKELIGMGGMANVYKAYDVLEKKDVAIKILKEEFIGNEEFLRRFRNESKAIAALSHPNIVKIMDVNFGDRIQYIVMEYIDGITLKEYIEQVHVLKWKDAVHFTVQILRALQHAHDKGIVHRDIKPQNIMLLQDGTIKVMDFGIARFARDERKVNNNLAIGSVHYISPEQARGEYTDEKSDVYSVGVMMYEMLTGRLPFDGDTPEKVAVMQMQASAKLPRAVVPSIPEGLEEIIVRAMQKDPSMRYQSAAEMLRDIDEFKRNPSIVFEYKYFPQDGNTRYFNTTSSVARPQQAQTQHIHTAEQPSRAVAQQQVEYGERKSPVLAVMTGVALTFIIFAVAIVTFFLLNREGPVEEVKVPSLVGKNYYEIKNDPEYADVVITIETTSYNDSYAKDIIYDQDPRPGLSVRKGYEVKVKVSDGSKPYRVPNIENLPLTDAEDILQNQGFLYTTVSKESDTVEKGNVINTIPARDEEITKDVVITIYYSVGVVKDPVTVPDVTGRPLEEAIQILEEYKLKYNAIPTDSNEEEGTVLEQTPNKSEIVDEGSTIDLKVSTGVAPQTTLEFSADIPSHATGKYDFIVYVNGSERSREEINTSAAGGKYRFSLSSNETDAVVTLMVKPADSYQDEVIFMSWSADFVTGTISETERNQDAFSGDDEDSREESSSSSETNSSDSGSGELSWDDSWWNENWESIFG
ncbi:MAG TPA: Stk1 family PASTA domain-containing Ser/Thr kinase [Firmicutes bacterium]|nr:Stk1 family PASTA domain-containing Ser/Thr kinase [Bacillota bacterium]